jgi:hypothetical protein
MVGGKIIPQKPANNRFEIKFAVVYDNFVNSMLCRSRCKILRRSRHFRIGDTLKLFLSLSLVRKAGKYSANTAKREVRRENTFAINAETSRSTILLNDFFCTTMLTHGWMEVRCNAEFRIVGRQFLLSFIRPHTRLRVKLFKPSNLLPTLLHLRQLRTIQLTSAIPTGNTPLVFFSSFVFSTAI